MSTATLKKSLGEGGAFIDESHGEDRLIDVLTALASDGSTLDVHQATIAAAVIASKVMDVASSIGVLYAHVAVTGTTTPTIVQLRVNTVDVGSPVTIADTEANGTSRGVVQGVNVVPGDLVEIEVTGAPTSGTGLTASLRFQPVAIEV